MKSKHLVTSGSNLSLVAFKAFGDLVIAVNCIDRRSSTLRARTDIILGEHLLPLFEALNVDISARVLHHGESSLPSLFTVRSDGVRKALGSAAGLKRSLKSACVSGDRHLVFDQMGIREWFVTLGFHRSVLPKTDNIYLSYDRFFDDLDEPLPTVRTDRQNTGPLRIFPGSRVPAKNLPVDLIRSVIIAAQDRGLDTELMLLEGERPDLEASGMKFTRVPRDFGAMISAVRGSGKVVSADSMPAHIAEHIGREMFVFSPVPNRYWLPRAAYLGRWDALVAEGSASSRLVAFLDAA